MALTHLAPTVYPEGVHPRQFSTNTDALLDEFDSRLGTEGRRTDLIPLDVRAIMHRVANAIQVLYAKKPEASTADVETEVLSVLGRPLHSSPDSGLYRTLHKFSIPSSEHEGMVVLAHLPVGNRAPTRVHRGALQEDGTKTDFGELTVSLNGTLFYITPESEVATHTMDDGVRVSPPNSADIYLRQQERPWTGVYIQPAPAHLHGKMSPDETAEIHSVILRAVEKLLVERDLRDKKAAVSARFADVNDGTGRYGPF